MGQGCAKVIKGDKAVVLSNAKGNKVDEKTLSFIAGVALFSYLEFEDHDMIAHCMSQREFKDKEEIVHEGDAGDVMYIIESGKALVMHDSTQLAKLSAGDYFGEYALLWDQPRSATVTAKGQLKCLALTRERFDALELKSVLHFPKRACLKPTDQSAGEARSSSKGKKKRSKEISGGEEVTDEHVQFIADALGQNQKLHEAMEFTREAYEAMARHCKVQFFHQGDTVIKQGDKVAEHMYIVKDGELSVNLIDSGGEKGRGEVHNVGTLKAGVAFGELALLFDAPRSATVLATTDANLFSLHRSALKLSLKLIADKRTDEVVKFLSTVPCLSGLLADERKSCAEAFMAVKFEEGEEVLRKGDEAHDFMILEKGEVVVAGAKKLDEKRYDESGHLVGAEEFFAQETYKNSMKAGLDGALLFIMDRETFRTLLSAVESAIKEEINFEIPEGGHKKKRTSFVDTGEGSRLRYPEAAFKDLVKERIIGAGGFGVVWLVHKKGAGSCCMIGKGGAQMAMKIVSKGLVNREKVQTAVQNERRVLSIMVNNPLIIHLYGTHKDAENVYFLMELGAMDVLHAYAMHKLFGKPQVASFHVATLACALEALHVRRIAYRDVKPENLLIDWSGRAKLCDMGIAKFVPGITHSVVGTPEYCAPEVFMGQGYSHSCDWWSLGVLVFELMTGGNPFNKGHDILSTISAVKKGFHGGKGHDHIPYFLEKNHSDCVELIKAVCQKKPKSRLPVGKTGQDDTAKLKEHAWFKDIDWENLAAGTTKEDALPFVPPEKMHTKKEPRAEDLPDEVKLGKEKCDWDADF